MLAFVTYAFAEGPANETGIKNFRNIANKTTRFRKNAEQNSLVQTVAWKIFNYNVKHLHSNVSLE